MLQLYVDSADRSAAEPLLTTGLYRGLATNPLLWERAGVRVEQLPALYAWATAAGAVEVFLQAWGADEAALWACAQRLRAIGPRVVVKVPATPAGTAVALRLTAAGVPVLLTAVYAAGQVLVAAAAGVTYLAPYVGRMTDAGCDAVREVATMQQVLTATDSPSRILAASLRTVDDVVALAASGVRCFALSPGICAALFDQPLTDAATADFERAAGQVGG